MVRPQLSAVVELLEPITWFPPMWAFACGVVASGVPLLPHWPLALLGVLLAGPLVCATSQAVNDWFDRHVDAINEPQRPIPSGWLPGRWALAVALVWTALSLLALAGTGWAAQPDALRPVVACLGAANGAFSMAAIGTMILPEGAALAWWHRRRGRGVAPRDFAADLVSGLCLMGALRGALAGWGGGWIPPCLAASGGVRAYDLWRRWH